MESRSHKTGKGNTVQMEVAIAGSSGHLDTIRGNSATEVEKGRALWIFCCLSLLFITFYVPLCIADDIPTILSCSTNAHASRDYGFREKAWMGPIPELGKSPDISKPFEITTKTIKGKNFVIFRDKVFSGLDTPSPIVKSITPPDKYYPTDTSVEFRATTISRTENAVFLIWTNDDNKVWFAVIDLIHRKAAISQVFQGVTSVGIEAETFDCK